MILVTGSTGVLGCAVSPALEEEAVFLVRGGINNKRLPALVDPNRIIAGDITQPLCGLSAENLRWLKSQGISQVLHMAASVKFDEDFSKEIFSTNLTGTKNVLALSKELGVREFHHVSTAYALTSRNPYERSKQEAEKLVKESELKYSIYRPGVLVGDSRTGQIAGFNGYYGVYTLLYFLAQRMRTNGNEVSLPVSVVCSLTSTINLVPVDWVRDMILKLMRFGARNKTFNITHPNPPKARWVMETGFRVLGIKAIQYLERPSKVVHKSRGLQILQEKIDAVLSRYVPYVIEEAQFSLKTTKRALGSDFSPPPKITAEFLALLLGYAVKENFGHRLPVASLHG